MYKDELILDEFTLKLFIEVVEFQKNIYKKGIPLFYFAKLLSINLSYGASLSSSPAFLTIF